MLFRSPENSSLFNAEPTIVEPLADSYTVVGSPTDRDRFLEKEALRKNEAAANKGGIDFDSKYLQMNMQGDGINIPVPQGFDWLLNTPIRGFTPQILDIVTGVGFELSFFKGLLTNQQQQTAKMNVMFRLAAAIMDHKFAMKGWVDSQAQVA